MRIDILTIFPRMFKGPFSESIIKRAVDGGLVSIHVHDIRRWSADKHRKVDDNPYGGGPGMVMKPEPLFLAVDEVVKMAGGSAPIVLLAPSGRPFNHKVAVELSQLPRLIMICGHYEGVDARVHEQLATDEISIGDYVLSGGELPAMVVVDSLVRHLPGALGDPQSAAQDSFAQGVLESPPYTRPAQFLDWSVPEMLLSGNHAEIANWRRLRGLLLTAQRRPDLLLQLELTDEEKEWLASNLGEL